MKDNLIAAAMITLITTTLSTLSVGVAAATVARWVDENGVTHFSDTGFAPATAQAVDVQPTNRMDAPVVAAPSSTAGGNSGPTFTKISLPPKQNKKGWRPRRESIYTGRRHSSGNRR
jgi:hypothetical protein